ncbi:hypothetical protein TNCV_2570421 [Trichonephila clavipes]|nr:hypothetical protein TNCV_2570421 [Trichonephila clavipes]
MQLINIIILEANGKPAKHEEFVDHKTYRFLHRRLAPMKTTDIPDSKLPPTASPPRNNTEVFSKYELRRALQVDIKNVPDSEKIDDFEKELIDILNYSKSVRADGIGEFNTPCVDCYKEVEDVVPASISSQSSRYCWRSPLLHASALIQRDFRCVLGVQQTKQLLHAAKVDLLWQMGV